MVFGVDNKPFEEANLPEQIPPNRELVFIYYIKFEGTALTIHEYKVRE